MKAYIKFRMAFLVLLLLVSSPLAAKEFRLGLVFDKGGKDDRSFNASAYVGAMRVKDDFKAFVKFVETTDDNAFEPLLRSFAQKNFDLIVAVGFSQIAALKKVAPQYPNEHFAIIDGEVNLPNVRSIMFEEHEGSYLVGALAGLTTQSDAVGFIGGMDVPLIKKFLYGFEAGAKSVKPKIRVVANFVGVTAESWNNPTKAKELALSQYDSGVDIIFSAAGASGQGLFDAAEEKKKFAIGVDSNQNGVKPGRILTSMVKRVDEAIYQTCRDQINGQFTSGTQRFGLANHGVDYAIDSNNEKLIPVSLRKRLDGIRNQIISGKIVVPDYSKIKK